jgi:hypothetical protein
LTEKTEVEEPKRTGDTSSLASAVEELLASRDAVLESPPTQAVRVRNATTALQPKSAGSITWLPSQTEVFNSTTPVSWTVFDLPSGVPVSCTAVVLSYVMSRAAALATAPLFEARINSDYEAVPIASLPGSAIAGDRASSTAICPVGSGAFEYQFSGSTDVCTIKLVGYY